MESLVSSIISKYLKDYVNNFRPEQVTVNFLSGQGVMRDLDLNVQYINDNFLQLNAFVEIHADSHQQTLVELLHSQHQK